MGQLVGPGQLAVYLQQPTRADAEEIAIRVAEGWLRSVTPSLTSWPQPPPEDLWAAALELAGIAYSNPQGLITRTVGDDTQGWAITRRQQVLDAVKEKYGGAQPQGSFPVALCWPDPPRLTWGDTS